MYGTKDIEEMFSYIRDLSWIETGRFEDSPYPNETIYSIGMLWGLIFIIDFIWSWSYTIFPSKTNGKSFAESLNHIRLSNRGIL